MIQRTRHCTVTKRILARQFSTEKPKTQPYFSKTTTAAFVLGGAGYYYYDLVGGTIEGLVRSIQFYSFAIPWYVVYRYHLFRQSPQETWDALDHKASQQALEKILQLQGFYIKCGQMAAANIGDAFPVIWQQTMHPLQDQVPALPFHVITSILDEEMPSWRDLFAHIDPIPIGSASIGQVHKAVLKRTGEPVVVKVCYPHVERLLRGDVRTMTLFCQVAQPVHVPALQEMEHQFQTEFDYRQEAMNMETVRQNMLKANMPCVVPKPLLAHCTKRVLVMEYLPGEKLAAALKREVEQQASLAGKSVKEYVKEQERYLEESKIPFVSNRQYSYWIQVEDMKRRWHNLRARLYNMSVGWLPGQVWMNYRDRSTLPLNHAQLVDDVIRIHGQQVLVDGFFNGDPHPGNILLCYYGKNEPPVLGLIDFGQVKRLTKEQRHLFCRLVMALDDDNFSEIVRLTKAAGYRSENMIPECLYKYAVVAYDEERLTGGKHIQLFMEELQAADQIITFPKDYLMVGRASILLRGLCHALHQPRSVAKLWRPIAERVLEEDL
ncbi:aarF domain-containing kinase [Fistulifera solaris]|uniref:AarF domain-containing kinase n=1 Tax=Fistulifera solaris TaxID=1519565 RepID=A0A1Z5KP64_FISSO|nr:aarF domain-containing kinase [Fistulifera solaris]|eukprot:GAX28066.1 aarF domain-containing kinase [Fistulifera solaris]